MSSNDARIILGRIVGVHGVRGWVKLHSDCRPREAILNYPSFIATRKNGESFALKLKNGRTQGKGIVAHFEGIDDRDQAFSLNGVTLSVTRDAMPELAENEFYWTDIIGLHAVNRQDECLGVVSDIFETGANDVLVIKQEKNEILIPFVVGIYVDSVDFDNNTLYVDWEREW